jgi:hypothetical protein
VVFFVGGEDADFAGLSLQDAFGDGVAEEAGGAGDWQGLVFNIKNLVLSD